MPSKKNKAGRKTEAEKLKTQGNEHFVRGENDAAFHKYSEAIKNDPTNAVLYANRAAVYLAKKNYLEAGYDAQKAVELDPGYAKAWGRLATASHELEAWIRAIPAWEKALECLPKDEESMTPTQKALKKEFEEGLKKSKNASAAKLPHSTVQFKTKDNDAMPWARAEALKNSPEYQGKMSSIFPMIDALEDWKGGNAKLNALKFGQVTPQGQRVYGENALELLTNAILADERVFHINDNAWFEKVEQQTQYENQAKGGWANSAGPAVMKEEIKKRLKAKGWNDVRPAIVVTLRAWIFSAYIRSRTVHHRQFANEMYARTLDIMEWGQKEWPNVSYDDKGPVFQPTFIRGVKQMKLVNMFEDFASHGADSCFIPDDLSDLAHDIIEDVQKKPPPSPTVMFAAGAHASFWLHPKGHALAILGWLYLQAGGTTHRSQVAERRALFQKGAEYYLQAAETFPSDDECHVKFLRTALECRFLEGRRPLRETLPLCQRIRKAMPAALKIWEVTAISEGFLDWDEELEKFEREHNEAIAKGVETLDTVAFLSSIPRRSKLDPRLTSAKFEKV